MDIDKVIEFAPYIIVVLIIFWQNNVFVRPEQLEKKHREILDDIKTKYVEINAYKEFQTHVYSKLDELTDNVKELKDFLMR